MRNNSRDNGNGKHGNKMEMVGHSIDKRKRNATLWYSASPDGYEP